MTWPFLAWSWLKNGATALFGFMRAYPWQFACLSLLCLSLWFLHGRTTARADLADRIAAEKASTGAQKRVNQAATKHYEDAANAADTKHDAMVADAFDATARYVASHRVQPEGGTCKAPAPAADSNSKVPAEVPANPDVAVSDVDVQRCSADATYAVDAFKWAQSLKMPEDLLPQK